MKVTLLSYTKDPEVTCAKCASVSWRRKGMKEISPDEARRIIGRVLRYGLESVIENACFPFFAEGISRGLTHQLVRHHIASSTQQSMTYVDLTKARKYSIRPKSISENEELVTLFDDVMAKCKSTYDISGKTGIPSEDSRFVWPIGSQTKIAVAMNARQLRHFFATRFCLRAQWEIRQLAKEA